ncbi:hypothetical protein IWW38_003965 [Coemansia aciculifera]|uniref:Uncharacterized protein n=1 Tax=Coemansia aciculifera TaxID=417176 RepID=A0ACC1M0X2_9FUNG|nr:hypothetical protein IWW38_003965 [Coemansia aciculifera]
MAPQPTWQKPFQYEAKVYASLSPDIPANATSYFAAAQLLWHIQPQSVENMYPLFRQRVSVNVPNQILSGRSFRQGLHLRIFIQQAGQFAPHPNLSDARLISLSIPLVTWKGVSPDKPASVPSVAHSEESVSKLVCVTSVSWAILLENRWAPYAPDRDRFYNPPLFRNEFTRSRPKAQPLAALKSEKSTTDVYPQTISVDLELSGIKLDWIFAFVRLNTLLKPTDKTVVVEKRVSAPWDPSETVTVQHTEVVKDDGDIPLDAVRLLSVPLKFAFILCRALMNTASPILNILGLYILSKPRSKWVGVSRTTLAILCISYVMNGLSVIGTNGVLSLSYLSELFTIYVWMDMDDMSFDPLGGLLSLFGKILFNAASLTSEKQQAAAISDKDESDSIASDTTSTSQSAHTNPIVATRRSVDEVAMYWLHLLCLLTFGTLLIYALLRQVGFFLSFSPIRDLLAFYAPVVGGFAWLPQIFVNHKARSGSLVPVSCAIYPLVYAVLSTIIYQLSGYDKYELVTVYTFPTNVFAIIILLQWVVYYRKTKLD